MSENKPKSPLPKQSKHLVFSEAIQAIVDGKKVTRAEWNNPDEYGTMKDGWLMIILNGKAFKWTVSEGDLLSNDWIIV